MKLVVVAGGGAAWESEIIDEIRHSDILDLYRRCLDVADVLSMAEHCDVAVVSTDLAGLDAESVASLQRHGVRVIGIGDGDRAFDLGMFVGRPGRIEEVVREPAADAPLAGGRVVAVWGPHGAPGRSVVAASVATAWAGCGRTVALVDADARGGALAQMFALLDDVSGLVAACRSANHGQLHDVVAQAVDIEPGLKLLTGVARADMWAQVRPGPFERVIQHLAQSCDVVIVDLGPGLEDAEAHVLNVADQVVVVGRADPVGLARLVRSLHDLRDVRDLLSLAAPTHVVINQVRSTSAWTRRDVADAVHRLAGVRPDLFVPTDHPALDTAVLRGKVPAQVSSSSPFAAAMTELVERMRVVPSR
jgi:MinD-like ATPase involved in chromosome partitioning or flagellar assembly